MSRRLAIVLVLVATPVAAQQAAHANHAPAVAKPHEKGGSPAKLAHAGPHAAPHWSYLGPDGPTRWGMLSPAFAACGTGRQQSPVNVRAPRRGRELGIATEWTPGAGHLVDNGHTLQVNVTGAGALRIAGEAYELLQFHFHTPSEHAVAGRRYPAEVHFVHRSRNGRLAVLGVPIAEGEPSEAWTALLAKLPRAAGDTVALQAPIELPALLGNTDLEGEALYRYAGSLTTPPCSEGVTWLLRERAVRLSAGQIARLAGAMGMNARPLQPLNGRVIEF